MGWAVVLATADRRRWARSVRPGARPVPAPSLAARGQRPSRRDEAYQRRAGWRRSAGWAPTLPYVQDSGRVRLKDPRLLRALRCWWSECLQAAWYPKAANGGGGFPAPGAVTP